MPDCHRSIEKQFGVGIVMVEVCEAIGTDVPKGSEHKQCPEITSGFAKIGFPNCAGAIGGLLCPQFVHHKEHVST